MFKGNKKYYYILATVFIAVIVLQYMQPKPINWSRTYLKKDKIPFGCFAIFNLLETNYAQKIEVNKETLYAINKKNKGSQTTLILVNNELEFSKLDLSNLFEFLKKGNTVVLAANTYKNLIKDTFKLETHYNWNNSSLVLDSLLQKKAFEIKYTVPKNNILKSYSYPTIATESYFSKFDTSLFKISSVNKANEAVLIEANIGKGRLLISSIPDVFGNLFIVNHANRYYTYTLLSSVKNKTILWDEYYKTYNIQQKGLFQFIFNNDALYMAYGITIIGLLFFMVFEIKRKQRTIPIIKPLQNSTLEFVDVISHVYFNSKNHRYIAEEAINYFYFYVRKKFQVKTKDMTEDEFQNISQLSNINLDEIKKLFLYCENIKQAPSLTENDLQELNRRITNFKNKSAR
jgi:hypothetical protein